MCAADGDGPCGSEVRMDSGDEKAKGEEGTEEEVWTGEGGGAVSDKEEGEDVMVCSERDRSTATDLCSALDDSWARTTLAVGCQVAAVNMARRDESSEVWGCWSTRGKESWTRHTE